MDIKKIFGKNLKRLRTDAGLTQEELAEKINVQPQTISNIESGRYFISPENFENICTVFQVKPLVLFLEFNSDKDLTTKEKRELINNVISTLNSELLDYFYRMFLAVQ